MRVECALMRIAIFLFFLTAGLCAPAQNGTDSLGKTNLFGRQYVLATEWAKLNKIKLQWVLKERELRATNETSRILLNMNSRFAVINGINFVLSCPVILNKERVYISLVDLKSTLYPILFPQKLATNASVKTICLDAGHGGRDPGNIDGKKEEKKYTLLLAKEVERILKQGGFNVIQTRWRDEYIERDNRPKTANQKKADLFVSLHFNSAPGNKAVQGSEVYCLTPEGTVSSNGGSAAMAYAGHDQSSENILLAYLVQKSFVKSLGVDDRSVKRAQFEVLLSLKCPGILIEGGYMTNPNESKRIYDATYRKKMALAIVDGILAYKKVVEQ
jgi:N-acetylmuramoyl-L-alanine amidase